jgi:FkbM family methyltransferase
LIGTVGKVPRSVPVLRSLLQHPRVEPLISACLRGRLVRESARFALREISQSTSSHVYRVRANGLKVAIAHRTPDVLTLDQAFYQKVYEPPPQVVASLQELQRPLRAIDLGANVGLWGLWLHGRFPVERLIAVEPDPENAAKHLRQMSLNGLTGSWELRQAAAGCTDQEVAFTVGRATTGRIAAKSEPGAQSVAGIDAFSLLAGVDLLKIDIEGAEWSILADPRWASVKAPVVMLEHHPYNAPSDNPAEDARRALTSAGYKTWTMHTESDGTGIVWGLRQ